MTDGLSVTMKTAKEVTIPRAPAAGAAEGDQVEAVEEAKFGADALDTRVNDLAEAREETGQTAGVAGAAADMETSGIGADSDRRVETGVLIAGHRDEGLTFHKLGRLKRLNVALEEQKKGMRTAWDNAMVDVENGLVFTELETLVVVAKDAVDSHQDIGAVHQGDSSSSPGCLWGQLGQRGVTGRWWSGGAITTGAAWKSADARAECTNGRLLLACLPQS